MAITAASELITYGADMDGDFLAVHVPQARKVLEQLEPGKKYVVEIKPYRKKRSLDANAMYWKILSDFAIKLRISNSFAHNMMLRRYGQVERYDDELVYVFLPDTEEAERKADEAETYHLKPTSQTKQGKDGSYRAYMLLRGSKTYDTSEFSRLLTGLIDECKEIGLDVLTERERELLYGVERN